MKRFLFLLEQLLHWLWLRRWPERMPGWFEEIWAGGFLVLMNAIRRVRFGTPHHCGDCDSCGLLFPLDDLQPITHSDGSVAPECVECLQFRNMIRSIHKPRAA